MIYYYKWIKSYFKLVKYARRMEMVTAEAEKRAKIISYFDKWGLQATIEAFGVKKSSIYRWKKLLKKSAGRLDSLNNSSRAPVRKRQPQVEAKIVQFICP